MNSRNHARIFVQAVHEVPFVSSRNKQLFIISGSNLPKLTKIGHNFRKKSIQK
jgi:hypothetical protein